MNDQIEKVVFGKNPTVEKFLENGTPFMTTFYPDVKDLGKLIKDLLSFLYSDEKAEKAFGNEYIGKTTNHFKSKWNNYKSEARQAESGNMENVKQKFLQSYILPSDHKGFLKDVEVGLIDKIQGSDPTMRKFFWMRTLRTFYPDGLNIERDY